MSFQEDVTRELIGMLKAGLTGEEIAACLERRVEDRERRLVAERDGWRSIARELLSVAFDGDLGAGDMPPLEVTELHANGKMPARSVPALQQFWRDLTLKHEAFRRKHLGQHVFRAAGDLQAGSLVVIDSNGLVVPAPPEPDEEE